MAARGETEAAAPVGTSDAAAAGLPSETMQWYVLKVQSNREKTIKEHLWRRIRREGLERFFEDIVIPTEKVAEMKGGKKKVVDRKLYPGYIMIKMILDEEAWYLVRDTSGVGDFTGAAGKPSPMLSHEVERMLGREAAKEDVPVKPTITVERGTVVKVKEGPFESFEGTVESIDEKSGKVNLTIVIFGRETPVELDHWQVEMVH